MFSLQPTKFILISLILVLSGCGKANFVDIKILEGNVITSSGSYPIEKREFRKTVYSTFSAIEIPELELTFNPLDGWATFIAPKDKKALLDIKPRSGYYQVNSESKVQVKFYCE